MYISSLNCCVNYAINPVIKEIHMSNLIKVDFASCQHSQLINTENLKSSRRELNVNLITPAIEDTSYAVAKEHSSEPIKSLDDIQRISEWLISNERYRDNMLFIVGINFGLRVSDLLTLRFSHLIDDDFKFKRTFPILEKKTSKTRKVTKNRYITINDAVIDAVILYLEHTSNVSLSDFMFRSNSNNSSGVNKPIHRNSVEAILKDIKKNLNLEIRMATHTLRKTFGYHQMMMHNNEPRALLLLQKIFGHSSSAQTLDYIGITGEEIEEAYLNLNLGTKNNYIDSEITETTRVG